jgi:hypothetical protein
VRSVSDQAFVAGFLNVLREAFEGGRPGQGTAFLDNTKADGSGNHGLLAALSSLSAPQASAPTVLGSSVASQASHVAFHIEATLRYVSGDRRPNDWQGSFEPRVVDDVQWQALRQRVKEAYERITALASSTSVLDEATAAGMAATLAHAAYHLGAIRQILKLARAP